MKRLNEQIKIIDVFLIYTKIVLKVFYVELRNFNTNKVLVEKIYRGKFSRR